MNADSSEEIIILVEQRGKRMNKQKLKTIYLPKKMHRYICLQEEG